jgi:hypothetical protein
MTMNRYRTRLQRLEHEGRKAGIQVIFAEEGQTEAEARAQAMAKRPDLPSRAFVVLMPEDRGF